MADPEEVQVLLVEDNPGDIRLVRDAFETGRIDHDLAVVHTGKEALEYVRANRSDDASRPDLVLLDLNLPGTRGGEFLDAIKGDPELRSIPVVVLTSSSADEDIVKSYERYANAYLTKPVNPDEFLTLVRALEEFWIELVKLPPGDDA